MNRKYDYLLIDSNLLYHKNYNANKDLTYKVKGTTIVTGGIYGFIRSIRKLKRNLLDEL